MSMLVRRPSLLGDLVSLPRVRGRCFRGQLT